MSDTIYINTRASHADVLASGRAIACGDQVNSSELSEEDAYLVEEGVLVPREEIEAGPDPGEYVEPEELSGDALAEKARALDIKGRSSMSVEELRAAIAVAENGEVA